jgi:signal transduction histidine kinase/ligand-binding sensor domain-containing protein
MSSGYQITLSVILVASAGLATADAQELGELALREQKLRFDHIRVEDGLSQNTINGILQDGGGFIWFGTEDGLNRYDGYGFKIYKHLPNDSTSLSNNYIWGLDQDSDGYIWIATDGGGINRFDPRHETFQSWVNIPGDTSKPAFSIVQTVMSDSSDLVYIGSWGAGLIRHDIRNLRFEQFVGDVSDSSGLTNGKVWSIYKDEVAQIWLGSDGGGLYRFNDDTRTFENFVFDSSSSGPLGCNSIIAITGDANGKLWVGTYGCGLFKSDPTSGRKTAYKTDEKNELSVAEDFIWKLFVDRYDRLWVGTMSNGLDWYDPVADGFRHYKHDEAKPGSLSSNDIRALYEDRSGNLWAGTLVGGINKTDLKKPLFAHIRHQENDENTIINDFVFAILEGRNGELWVGTYGGGLTRYDPRTGRFRHYTNDGTDTAISSDQIRCVYEDDAGEIWIGTYFGGLNLYDRANDSFRQYRKQEDNSNGLRDENIRNMLQDSKGRFWIGTNGGGLHRFDRSTGQFKALFHSRNDPQSINSDYVISIAEGIHDDLWVGTYGGGLSRLRTASEAFETFRHDSKNPPGAWEKTATGWFYFGGANGINAFRPEDVKDSRFQPELAITDFEIFNESVKGFGPPLTLDYSERFFSFEFSSFDYTNPAKNRYRYKLDGFDEDWIDPERRRYASYTNLDPGEYVFRLVGSNSDGIWSPKEVKVPLTIVPPFWATTWFRFLAAVMFLAMFGIIYSSRVAYLKREKRTQERFTKMLIQAQEQERKRIASELHDSLGQDLLIINAGLDRCLAADIRETKISREIRKLKQIASNSIRGVREISADLHSHLLDKLGLKKAIESMAKKVAASSDFKLNLQVAPPQGLAKDAEINIYRILQEGLNNIRKHSGAKQVSIFMQPVNGRLEFSIHDDGSGFDSARTAKKPGLGLTTIAERVKLLNGQLEIKSARREGTEINVSIPITNSEG